MVKKIRAEKGVRAAIAEAMRLASRVLVVLGRNLTESEEILSRTPTTIWSPDQ